MKLTKTKKGGKDLYVAIAGYEEKDIPKSAGFTWNRYFSGKWATFNIECAYKLKEFADSDLRNELEQLIEKRNKAFELSRQTDTDFKPKAPEGQEPYPFQKVGVQYALNPDKKGVLIADSMGLGKAQPLNANILTHCGWRKMGDIQEGDLVCASDGKFYPVTGVFPQGEKEVYKVTFQDGAATECCDEHLWLTRTPYQKYCGKGFQVKELREFKNKLMDTNGNRLRQIPITKPIRFERKKLYLHPYIIGVLLGDGCLKSNSIELCNPEEDLLRKVEKHLPKGYRLTSNISEKRCPKYRIVQKKERTTKENKIKSFIEGKGLRVNSPDKFIPREYKYSSIGQRISLLQGLLDTDGGVSNAGCAIIEYCSTSEQLCDDVQFLIESLGGKAVKSIKEKPRYTYNGELKTGRPAYRLNISFGPGISPFWCKRKRKLYKPRSKYLPIRSFMKVEPIGKGECQCISIASPDHSYLTDRCIVTHNTCQAIMTCNDLKVQSILVICPASLKLNWKREIENWDIHSLSVEVIDSKTKKKDIPTTGYVIVNYDIVKKFHEQLTSVEWDVLICDEAHYMKNPKAQRTKLIMGWRPQSGKKSKPIAPIQAKKKLFLTGTPILNKPVELWPLVHNLAPETFNNFMWYAKRYCAAERGYWGWDFSGASNLEELQELLRKTCMVRRLKSEVLTELPDKVRQVLEIPPNGSKEINKLVKEEQEFASKRKEYLDSLRAAAMVAKVAGSKDEYRDIMDKLKGETATLFEEVAKIRVAMAKEKAPYCIEHLESMIESGIDKVIFFGHHKVLLNAIKDHFGDRAVILTGETGDQERQDAVDQFQENPDVQIFIGSIKAAGVGITLTASSNVVFGELDWTPGWMEQSEDRCILGGQPIMTPNGWKLIEEIQVGDMVITHTGKAHKVIDTWSKSNRKATVELKLEGWLEIIELTHDHRVLANTGWVEATNLKPGFQVAIPTLGDCPKLDTIEFDKKYRLPNDFIGVNGKQSNGRLVKAPEKIELNDDALFTFGYYIGDGFCRTDGSRSSRFVSMSGNSEKKDLSMRRVEDWFSGIGCNKSERGKSREWRFFSGEWAYWFEGELGRTCFEKKIPEWIFSCSQHQRRCFLAGMVASDGYYRKGRYEYVTANKNLAAQAARLIAACGHKPCVTKNTTQHWVISYTKGQPCWLNVKSVLLRHGRKSERVYDLTVGQENSFVVGTAVVHNCHRIGQQESVLIQYLVFQDSLDAEMGRMLADKGRVIDTALDSEIALKEISALDRVEVEKLEAMKREAEKRPISAKKKEIEKESKGITKTQIQAIHDCLKTLSSYCDGAKEFDGSGFNRVDVYIGHELAGAISLSPKQAALGCRIVKKYCRQLPGDLYKEAMGG